MRDFKLDRGLITPLEKKYYRSTIYNVITLDDEITYFVKIQCFFNIILASVSVPNICRRFGETV